MKQTTMTQDKNKTTVYCKNKREKRNNYKQGPDINRPIFLFIPEGPKRYYV